MPIQLHMLGVPRISIDGQSLAVAWQRHTLALLAYLVTAPGAQPRDTVAFALWPDDDEETARANLRRNLNHLRSQLPPEAARWIVADSGSVEFVRELARTDVARFESAIDEADDLTAAVGLYTGDFAAPLDQPYVRVERERLRARFHAALMELIGREISRRRFDAALAHARRIASDEPFREDVLRRVIAIRYAMGDRPGALIEFDRFARELRIEMNIDPLPETIALRDLVLRGEPLPIAPDAGPAPRLESPRALNSFLPFTGRRAALDTFDEHWASACTGRGTTVFVRGEAGIGKTRAIAEFLDRRVGASGRILRGTTTSPEARPYEALLAAFGQAAPFVPALELETVWLAELAELVPELGPRIRARPRTPLPAERESTRLLEAFARFATAVARNRATVIVLEDVHWARASTFDALRFLAARVRRHPILILATCRSGENPVAEALVASLCSAQLAHEVRLGRLTFDETLAVLDRAQPPVRGERARDLAERSDGHPLFLTELVRDDVEHGETTGGISELVVSRLRRCSPGAQVLAQIAAVCGATFDLELLSQTAGWDDGPLIDGLAELLQRQFIRSTAAHERGGYAFSHALIHASVLETLDERARRRTHRLAARVLESRAAGTIDAAEIARHWAAAGDAQRAAAAYAHAARGSLAANARTEAAALATRGLQFATDPQVRYDLIEMRIAANRRQAPVDVLRADVDLLRQVAQTLDDNARFEAARAAFEVEELSGDSASRSAAMEQLHRYCDGASASVRGAQIADAQARHDALRERFSDALAHARDASARYAACGKPREALAMSIFVARVLVNQIRLDDALAVVTSVESQIVTLDDPVLSIDYWYVRGIIPSRRRDPAAALHAAKMLHDLARSVGDRIMEGHAAVLRSAAYSHLSQLSQALRELDAAEEIFTSIGVSAFAEVTRNNRASILLQIGRVDEATLILREQYADARATGADDSLYFAASNLGCAMLASDRVDEALRLQREALAIARSLESDGHAALALGDLGAAEVAAGDPVAGSAHLREAIAINRQLNRTAVLAHDLARAACAESDVDAAAAHARGALAIVEADPTQIALAPEILHRSAIALERAADRSAAAFCMRRARELLAERLAALDTADRKLYVALPWHAALSEPQEAAMQLAPGRNNASAAATASSRYANPARS